MAMIEDRAVKINANSLNKTLKAALEDGSLAPSVLDTKVNIPNGTSWAAYTPVFTGFGTVSNVNIEWRQNLENIEIRGSFTAGVTTAVEGRMSLPNAYISSGATAIPSIQVAGEATYSAAASLTAFTLIEPSVGYITFGIQSGTAAGLTKANGSTILGSGNTLSLKASIPVSGLTATSPTTIKLTQAGLYQEADGHLQINAFTPARGTTNTCIVNLSSGTIVNNIGNHVTWSSSASLGDTFTVTKTGIYTFNFSSDLGSTAVDIGFSKNSVNLTTTYSSIPTSEKLLGSYDGGGSAIATVSYTGLLTAGDVIRVHTTFATLASPTSVYSAFSCTYQGNLKQVTVNPNQKATIPTHEVRYEGITGLGTGTDASVIKFTSLAKIRGDGLSIDNTNGTKITVMKAGRLSINACVYINAINKTVTITKNQPAFPTVTSEVVASSNANATMVANVAASIDVVVGDVIRVVADSAPAAATSNLLQVSLQEQAVSVSVSNTLPQFTDTDSSVRVSTAAGFGSTGTKIVRFTNVQDNLGSDITYVPSTVNGDSWVVNSDGIYNVSFSYVTGTNGDIGISKNQATLTTTAVNLSEAERLCMAELADTGINYGTVSNSIKLLKNDVIRAVASTATSSAVNCQFTISKVGKPNVTGVDVTPFTNVQINLDQEYVRVSGNGGFGSTSTGVMRFSTIGQYTNKGILRYVQDAVNGDYFQALKRCKVAGSVGMNIPAGNPYGWIGVYDSLATQVTASGSASAGIYTIGSTQFATVSSGTQVFPIPFNGILEAGQILRAGVSTQSITPAYFIVTADALSDTILTAPETFSTDTANLQWSSTYTTATLPSAPVGTVISFTGGASAQATTQCTTAPTQAANTFNQGLLLTSKVFTAAGNNNTPCRFDIQIGKGYKGFRIDAYSGINRTGNSVNLDFYTSGAGIDIGCYTAYNENTGVLTINSGFAWSSNGTRYLGTFVDGTTTTTAYINISASKSPALVGVPQVQPRFATLTDVKPSGTHGGTSVALTWNTRTLNTIDDPTGFVTSLASNQFTLPAGTYYLEGQAAGYRTKGHRLRLRSILPSAVTYLTGVGGYLETTDTIEAPAFLKGQITLSAATSFELQHYITSAVTTTGLGNAVSTGENEVYATLKITKVK